MSLDDINTVLEDSDEVFAMKICRTCMAELKNEAVHLNKKYLFPFEARESIEFDIKTMLMLLTPLKFTQNDYYPEEICNDCVQKLVDSFSFRLLCIKSDSYFRNTNAILSLSFNEVDLLENNTVTSNDSVICEFLNIASQINDDDDDDNVFTKDIKIKDSCDKFKEKTNLLEKHQSAVDCTVCKELQLDTCTCLHLNENMTTLEVTDSYSMEDTKRIKRKYACHICGKLFAIHNGLLEKHMARHTDKKSFQCETCDKSFFTKCDLRKHKILHSAKSFICHSCGAAFFRKDSLKAHVNSHLGIKKKACPHCDKLFLKAYNLTAHIRIHSEESPFKCTLCTKKFKQKSGLTRHIKIHKKK